MEGRADARRIFYPFQTALVPDRFTIIKLTGGCSRWMVLEGRKRDVDP